MAEAVKAPPGELEDLIARQGRLSPVEAEAAVVCHPRPRGDHLLNPDLADDLAIQPVKDAAVLVPLVPRADTLNAVFTLRAGHLSAHAGQVAFPGGKIDLADGGPLAAALREAHEEVGLDPGLVTPLGFATPYVSQSGYRIVPVVAVVDPAAALVPNPDEVDAVFEVPWSFLMRAENHLVAAKAFGAARRRYYRMPWGEFVIWGVTAGIVRGLFEELYP